MSEQAGEPDVEPSRMGRILAGVPRRLRAIPLRAIRYTVTAAIVLIASIWAEPTINDYLRLDSVRYSIFQYLTELAGGHYLEPKFAKVVLIEDDDYWDGELQHRAPTNRIYLAKLVKALDAANAHLIALDYDLRLSHEDLKGIPGDYAELKNNYAAETDVLVRAIDTAAEHHRKIVLARTINGLAPPYQTFADAYQPYGLCAKLRDGGRWDNPGTTEFPLTPDARGNIACGYIALPFNKMRLPLMIDIGGGHKLDSFALAMARLWDPHVASRIAEGEYYGSYIPMEVMKEFGVKISAHAVLAGDREALNAIDSKLVIVGSGWHQNAFGHGGDGGLVDLHASPIGAIGGALMHGNFVEAILSGRVSSAIPSWILVGLEILFGVAAAVLFYRYSGLWVQVATFGALLVVLVAVQWVMMGLFYTYFDALVPLVGLAIHSLGGRILEEKA